ATTWRKTSAGSPPRLRMRSTASSAPALEDDVISLERTDRVAEVLRNLAGLALVEVDEHRRLRCRDEEQVVVYAVRGAFVGRARTPDARDADEELEFVVEDCGRVILDRQRAQNELDVGVTDLY